MTKFAKKHLSRCVGLYLVGAVAIGAGVAVYDMPSAYAFTPGQYNTINNNLAGSSGFTMVPEVGELTGEAGYKLVFEGKQSSVWISANDVQQQTIDLNSLVIPTTDEFNIALPEDGSVTLTASGKLDNANTPINIANSADLKLEGDTEIAGSISVANGSTLNVTADNSATLTSTAPIVNSGAIEVTGATIDAPITNNGSLSTATGTTISGTVTNAANATITASAGTTISGDVNNAGTLNLNGAALNANVTGESGTVAVSGTVTGTGSIAANTVSVAAGADVSGANIAATTVNVADNAKLGTVATDTLKVSGTGEGVTGAVKAKKVSVGSTYTANNSALELTAADNAPVQIVVDTADKEAAAKAAAAVAGSIQAKEGDTVQLVVSTTEGATDTIEVTAGAGGTIDTGALEEQIKTDSFAKPPIDTPDTPSQPTPAEQATIDWAADPATYDVFDKNVDFLDQEALQDLQAIDAKYGTSHYKNALTKLQKVASPMIGTRQGMQLANNVAIGNVSDRLDAIRTDRGHVGVYPEKGNVKGARDEKDGNLWASIKHGDTDVDDISNVKYNQFQIGYDHQVGEKAYLGIYGGMTTGDITVNGMESDIDSAWNLGLYGTRLLPQGQYLNFIGQYGKMTNQYRTAEWDNKGYTLALEYGQKIQQPAGFTITPYVQLVYDHASDSTVSGVYVPMAIDSSNAWNAKIGAKFEDNDGHGNNVYGGIAYSKGIGGSYATMLNGIRLPEVDNDLGVIFINLGVQHRMSESSYFDLSVEKEMLDYDGWNVQGVVNFAF